MGAAVFISFFLPVIPLLKNRKNPAVQAEIDRSIAVTHAMAERFDLFTIIVLEEVVVGVIRGLARNHHLNWMAGATAALGMLIAIAVWWVFFR